MKRLTSRTTKELFFKLLKFKLKGLEHLNENISEIEGFVSECKSVTVNLLLKLLLKFLKQFHKGFDLGISQSFGGQYLKVFTK